MWGSQGVLTAFLLAIICLNCFSLPPCQALNATPYAAGGTVTAYDDEGPDLSVSIKTDKPAYLAGENIKITCSNKGSGGANWVAESFKITVNAEYENGDKQEIVPGEHLRGQRTYNWKLPGTPGSVRISCAASASYQVTTTNLITTCFPKGGCVTIPVTSTQDIPLEGFAEAEIQVYDSHAPVSGMVLDQKGKPVSGAAINLGGEESQPVYSDAGGNFSFGSYRIGAKYVISNDVPSSEETLTVQAVACEPVKKAVTIPAGKGISNVKLSLNRQFYPAGIDLADFKQDMFAGWDESAGFATWQNMVGVTLNGPLKITRVTLGDRVMTVQPFSIREGMQINMIPGAEVGRYFVDLQSQGEGKFALAAAATVGSKEFEASTCTLETRPGEAYRVVVVLEKGKTRIEKSEGLALPWLILIVAAGLLGGLSVAFIITGGKFGKLKQAALAGLGKIAPRGKKTVPGTDATTTAAAGENTRIIISNSQAGRPAVKRKQKARAGEKQGMAGSGTEKGRADERS